jgi:hypothetical protein
MALKIETAEDFRRHRASLEPTYITSRTHGPVLVPCCSTFLARPDMVMANAYNPNSVAPDKMDLLRQSILDNGFCFPLVTIWDDELAHFVIVDGFHRSLIGGAEWLDFDFWPVVIIPHDITRRMTATVQFNKARGVHQVDLDAEIVRTLCQQGMPDEEIATRLGMDLEAVHRYKQITGVAELFRNTPYSLSWEMVEGETE